MIQIDDKELKRFEKDLLKFKKSAFPFASKTVLNNLAFESMKVSKNTIGSKMTLRNKFTQQSVRYEKTNTLDLKKQESKVGSIAPYMETQEIGGRKNKTGKVGVSISTGYSAGQEGSGTRTKLPTNSNKMKNIILNSRTKNAKSRKQRNFLLIKESAKNNKKFVFLDLGKTKGIFKLIGGKKNTKIKMVHSLSNKSVTIKKNEWLQPSVNKALDKKATFYKDALIFQLKRHKLFNQ
jgi:hypothetical protein